MRLRLQLGLLTLAFSAVSAFAQNTVLIINGSSTTSESGTTSDITANLQAKVVAAGGTATVVDAVPSSFAGYGQVWDIRFSNSAALTSGQISQYVSYLASGGVMFVMGENDGFPTRNNSVISLVAAAGGGTISFLTPSSTQTVLSPFTGPNAVSTITYNAPGGAGGATPGNGAFMTRDSSNNGTGVVWNKTTMTNASNGVLSVVFDVNWMQGGAPADSQNFLRNLINFNNVVVGGGSPQVSSVPALNPTGMALMVALMGYVALRQFRVQNI